ncbi:hypothetical protein GCM10027176_10580 [Actinoallomurus bryophytorum]|uniref:Uncharacterized protein n=1 Tax=Actinoallomurus bryophytorum TaxID=1490222 RepID=A0A543BZD3_9ACTN|nr:hypothetical protein [Actinoallomurus bryophytorum]TQL90179.1 hypothetical protein FB559_7472 [Actinoallomurus bryophytorum]
MSQNGQADFQDSLIEPQGVNAGAAVDAETSHEDPPEKGPVPPTTRELNEARPDEMVGLPEQIPGYPGQQRSMDTS